MKKNFESCMVMLLENEGGYQDDDRDPGNHGDGYGNPGSTNWESQQSLRTVYRSTSYQRDNEITEKRRRVSGLQRVVR